MRKVKYTLFLLVLSILIVGCSTSSIGEESPHGEQVNLQEDITITLDKETYSAEGNILELTTRNESDEKISFGVPFSIEMREGDDWYIVEPNEEVSFIMIAYILEPDGEFTDEISLSFYEALKPGQYRLIRQIDSQIYAAEFTIEAD